VKSVIPFPQTRYNIISDEAVSQIHEAAMRILNEPGIRIEDPKVRERLGDRGCTLCGDRVKIARTCVENALSHVNGQTTLGFPEGSQVHLHPDYTVTHTTGGMPFIIDLQSGRQRQARSEDLISLTQLINTLEQIDINCAMIYLEDVPPAINQLKQCELLLRYSAKPIFVGVSSQREGQYVIELLRAATAEHLPSNDISMGVLGISPQSPLFYPKDITETIDMAVTAGITIVMLPAPIAGFTSPLTIAGGLVQQHANMLAFACIAALARPQTRLIYGARLAFANLKTGNSIWGLPEVGIAGAAAVRLAAKSGFLSDVYGLCCTACTVDNQAGYEKALNAIIPLLAGTNLISGFGGLASLTAASHEQLAIDNEMFAMMKRIVQNFQVNPDTLAQEVIAAAAAGDDYVTSPHTIRHLRSGELFIPDLAFDDLWDEWTTQGSADIQQRAQEKVEHLLGLPMDKQLSPEIEREFTRIIASARKNLVR
jgi:trimethylamine--corrinoid protein Co-methyltransferase